MGNDKRHALAGLIVDQPIARAAENAQHDGMARRAIEHCGEEIDDPLRLPPVAEQARLREIEVTCQIADGNRLLEVRGALAGRRRIKRGR